MKKSKLLLVSGLLGTAYLIYLVCYFVGGMASAGDNIELAAGGLATAIVMPHMVCVALAVAFNWLGWFLNAPWGALVAGILYAVSMVLMFLYALFVVVQMVLCFIAYAKMKKAHALSIENNSTGKIE